MVSLDIAEILEKFPAKKDCLACLEMVRWKDGPVCPYCRSVNSTALSTELRHHCNNCNTSFSVTVGTLFHHTHLPLQKWFLALLLTWSAEKNISSRQLSQHLQLSKNTAWAMQKRIRDAMIEHRELISDIVEMVSSWNGGPRPDKCDSRARGEIKSQRTE